MWDAVYMRTLFEDGDNKEKNASENPEAFFQLAIMMMLGYLFDQRQHLSCGLIA